MQKLRFRQLANNTQYAFEGKIKLPPDKVTHRLALIETLNDYVFNKVIEDCKLTDRTMPLVEPRHEQISNADFFDANQAVQLP